MDFNIFKNVVVTYYPSASSDGEQWRVKLVDNLRDMTPLCVETVIDNTEGLLICVAVAQSMVNKANKGHYTNQ